MAGKITRLSKAARDLNVGISTLIEFLNSKGVEIDSNPNTKLEPEHYDLLRVEFAADQSLKEEVEKKKGSRAEKRKTISLRGPEEEMEVEEKAVPAEQAPVVETKPEPAPVEVVKEEEKVEEVKEPAKAEKVVETPATKEELPKPEKVEEKPAAEVKEEVKASPEAKETKETEKGDVGPTVLGRIDLDSINTKTRPDKKKKDYKKEKEASKKVEHKPAPAKPEPKKEVEKPKENVRATDPEREFIPTRVQKLDGPVILGKMDLSTTPDRKKKSASDNKRKRTRIKKVDPAKAGQATTGQTGTAGQGQQRGPQRGGPAKGKPTAAKGGSKPSAGKTEITEQDIERGIKETLARMAGGGKSKAAKNRRAKRETFAERREKEALIEEVEMSTLKLTEFVSVSELAIMMDVQATDVISTCMSLGIFASINQRLDAETIQIVADEFGFDVEFVSADIQEAIQEVEDKPEDLEVRPPIITVMGHVDHGKTSLLDYIRKANIADGEAGGITQHIGAYSVKHQGRTLTFLDTPGHEAFTAMRARGAQVTDVAIIIIAADDDVMPQTKEAISHAQAAGVPMVFALNKVDKPTANPDKIKEQLSQMNILVEDWGGKYQVQEISAKFGKNIDELLEKVLLESDLLDLKANPKKNAVGTVLESSLDKGKGYVTNMLVEAGTLRVGDIVLAGKFTGRVRAMLNEKGKNLKVAPPATPVSILGINGAPSAGDKFHVMDDEREARNIATRRDQLMREQGLRTQKHITLDEIGRRLAIGDFQELNLIIKGDVDGSIEALADSLLKLSTPEIQINIIHKAVGAITEADVNLASASEAIIIGFQVRPTTTAKKMAMDEQIDIRLYSVIYKAIDELKAAMEGMLSPDIEEVIVGTADVRETFNITKIGTIAGCYVTSGYIQRNSLIRVIRNGIVIHEGTLGSLKRFKDDVKEVRNNYECGLNINNFNDLKVDDTIEAYEEREVARKL